MTSILLTDLFIIVYILVDDWYQTKGKHYLQGKAGVKPEFTDSEVITLMLIEDFIPYPSETQNIAYIRANYLTLFHKLVRSQFNRRSRNLRLLVEKLRQDWIQRKSWQDQHCFLLDTKPVPVLGYKLVTISTLLGIPIFYDLVPAITDERQAAEAIIDHFVLCDIFGDKGFIGLDWQTLNRFLSNKSERTEGVLHEIQDVGRNFERLLAKTVLGLATRVITKMTSHILRRLLLVDFGVNVQTFAVSSPA